MSRETQSLPKAVEDCHALLAWDLPGRAGFRFTHRAATGAFR